MSKTTADRILDAAAGCFAESGYSGTSTRTLAAAAGVNVATLAYHFKGKEGLYQAAIDRLYEQFFAVKPELDMSPNSTPESRVEAAIRFAYRFALEHRTGVRLLLRHVLEHGHPPDTVRDGWTAQLMERAQLAWHLLGLEPAEDWKLKLLTMNHLIARFVISEPTDLVAFVDAEEPHQVLEDHLVRLGVNLLTGSV